MIKLLIINNQKGNHRDGFVNLLVNIYAVFTACFLPKIRCFGHNLTVIKMSSRLIEHFLCIYRSSYPLCLIFKQLDFP